MLFLVAVCVGVRFLCVVCQEGTHAEVTTVSLVNVAENENVITLAVLRGERIFFFIYLAFVLKRRSKIDATL